MFYFSTGAISQCNEAVKYQLSFLIMLSSLKWV